jgi:hypothetical protein
LQESIYQTANRTEKTMLRLGPLVRILIRTTSNVFGKTDIADSTKVVTITQKSDGELWQYGY